MKKVIKLKEGELICPICKGKGHLDKSIYVCEKCDGNGIVDWVSNVITRKKKRTALDKINIKRMLIHLQSLVDSLKFESIDNLTINTLKGMMDHYLKSIKDRKLIDDYQFSKPFAGGYNFNLSIKPFRSVEVVNMNVKII